MGQKIVLRGFDANGEPQTEELELDGTNTVESELMWGNSLPSEVEVVPTIEESNKFWVVDKDKTDVHWLEVQDPEGWYRAIAKWDGCVHYNRYFNLPYPQPNEDKCSDYIHYCELDEEIERLIALRDIAGEFYKDHWYGAWDSE